MTDILSTVGTRATPQSQAADPRQVVNAAGGYVFTVDDMARLKRFLTLGTEGGTYYAGAADHTFDNFDALRRVVAADSRAAVDTIVDVSTRGAAPKQNPALFALAYAAAHGDTAYALSRLPEVARTGTHLFLFAGYVEQFRGWGRGLRRAVAGWYTGKDADDLAYQVVKYRQRGGWSHRDLLRLAHPVSDTPGVAAVLRWVATGDAGDGIPPLVEGFLKAQEPGADIPALVRGYGLSWEMLPTEALDRRDVWDALLDAGVPQTALMRNLPRLTNLGLLPQMGGRTAEVAARLVDPERLRRGRVHPMNVLVAHRTYASGKSLRGTGVWSPTPAITDALDQAFYASYGAVRPSGKRTLFAVDVSGSMDWTTVGGLPLTPRHAAVAMALVTAATEPEYAIVAFCDVLTPLGISPRQRLAEAIRETRKLRFGGTDCALPMLWALQQGLQVDTFIVATDSETWAGSPHPYQALRAYREKTGIDAKLVVLGMTATQCSIADPTDPGMLDVVGFDTAVPQTIADFARGF